MHWRSLNHSMQFRSLQLQYEMTMKAAAHLHFSFLWKFNRFFSPAMRIPMWLLDACMHQTVLRWMMDKLRPLLLFDFEAINFRLDDYLNVNRHRFGFFLHLLFGFKTFYDVLFCFVSALLGFQMVFLVHMVFSVWIFQAIRWMHEFLRPPVWQIKFQHTFFIWFYGQIAEIARIDAVTTWKFIRKTIALMRLCFQSSPAKVCEIAIHFSNRRVYFARYS